MTNAGNFVQPSPLRDAAAWDRIWSHHPYRQANLRAERARIKVAAAIELGLKFGDSDRVLDIACGSGHTLTEAAARVSGKPRFLALDISAVALDLACANFKRAGVHVLRVRGEWLRLPLRTGSVDIVLAFMAPVPAVTTEIERVLAPGGKLFMIAPSRRSITSVWYRMHESLRSDPFNEKRNYAAPELISLLAQHFVVEEWRVLHCAADRRFAGTLDRAIARVSAGWGRYIVVRCRKLAIR